MVELDTLKKVITRYISLFFQVISLVEQDLLQARVVLAVLNKYSSQKHMWK